MKHIFIARHAFYGDDDRIDSIGKRQAQTLSEAIKQITNGGSVHIISSTAPRALDTAEILASNLGVQKIEQMEYLWAADDAPKGTFEQDIDHGYATLDSIIKKRENLADSLVMMTHLGILDTYPRHFLDVFLNLKMHIDPNDPLTRIPTGYALHADLEARTYNRIP